MPEREYSFAKKIQEAHPDFQYMFWNNKNMPKLPEPLNSIKDYHQSHKNWVHIADLLRYYVVKEHGGLYIDCDYELINPISNLELEKYDGFIPLHFNVGETICNSIFGFSKDHPILQILCEKAESHKHWLGPHFFGKFVKSYLGLEENANDIDVSKKLNQINVLTVHSRENLKINYLNHHLSYTWHPDNQKKMKTDETFVNL